MQKKFTNLFKKSFFCKIVVVAEEMKRATIKQTKKLLETQNYVDSVVEWLKRRAREQHGLGSKPTYAILLCPWEKHFTAHSPAWWFWQAVLN